MLLKITLLMKQVRLLVLTLVMLMTSVGTKAQYTTKDIHDYIATYSTMAIKKMKDYGIPASITLAQGILESAAGTSDLAKNANNHFGIKCHSDWEGKKYFKDDDKKHECFRSYATVEQSFDDHSAFLKRSRYASLFSLEITDYKAWARELKKCGYATDPNYADRLIVLIETYSLHQFDTESALAYENPLAEKKANDIIRIKDRSFAQVAYPYTNRPVYLNNKVYFILAKQGDSFYDIAVDVQLTVGQLKKYNDINTREYNLTEGEMVYISTKAKRSEKNKEHRILPNETLRDIAQYYAITEKSLRKLNKFTKNTIVGPGYILRLQ
ncbi:MAG: glucosaminidase domain-containing protein [Bacteroidales bacterium]|nr:glucosaminidase domain-containing protein [Bacteroidales bacterium]